MAAVPVTAVSEFTPYIGICQLKSTICCGYRGYPEQGVAKKVLEK
jgi:hypothetical protein